MIKTPKYTRDLLPAEFTSDSSEHIHRFQYIESQAREMFRRYGFREIRTPIFEHTELFARGVGAETDIVSKEMFTWTDINGESLTLRPENTASVIRAFIEHKMWANSDLVKLYYIGPQFRRERGQKGRFRQFYQIGAEIIGKNDNPAIEAESIEMLVDFIQNLGILDAELRINSVGDAESRPRFVEMIKRELADKILTMCHNCQRRYETNPLRILDCKEDQATVSQLPSTLGLLSAEAKKHFETFRRFLDQRNIPYVIDHRLVRGLDYYTKTVFEIVSGSLGAQSALLGGGRYDGLSETIGGPPAKGFGFALGLDRFAMILPDSAASSDRPDVFIAHLGENAFEKAGLILRDLRREGIAGYLDFDKRSLKSAMKLADKLGARFVMILGDSELESGQWILRSMADSTQTTVTEQSMLNTLREMLNR